MNRREFFRCAGTWAAVTGFGCAARLPPGTSPTAKVSGPAPTSQDPAAPGKPKGAEGLELLKSIRIDALQFKGTFLQKFSLVKDLGFDGIELESPLPAPNADEYVKMREQIMAARDETDLTISCVHNRYEWTQPFTDPDPMNRRRARSPFYTAVGDASIYGAGIVRVMPGFVSKEVAYDDAWIWVNEGLEGCVRIAESARSEIKILIENARNSFLLSPMEMARFVDDFDSDLAGVFLDIGNVLPNGWPEHWVRSLGDRIGMIGVSNFSAKKGNEEGLQKGFEVGFQEGDCDWPAVFDELRTIGFSSSPGVLQIFIFVPILGILIFIVAQIWMLVAMVIAVRQALDYHSTLRAVGVCALGWFVRIFVFALLRSF